MASLLVRLIGMIYRIPMANILGEEGNGIYAVAYEIYDVVLIISSYSLPLALSKIISAEQARGEYRNVGKTFRVARTFAIVSGGVFGAVLLFGAGLIETSIYPEYSGVRMPEYSACWRPLFLSWRCWVCSAGFFRAKRQ